MQPLEPSLAAAARGAAFDARAPSLAAIISDADAGFTLRVYARDARDTATVVSDVLERAERAGVAS
jgi:hypothetical protein